MASLRNHGYTAEAKLLRTHHGRHDNVLGSVVTHRRNGGSSGGRQRGFCREKLGTCWLETSETLVFTIEHWDAVGTVGNLSDMKNGGYL